MSTPPAPATDPASLNADYLRLLHRFDGLAVRYKRHRQWVWNLATFLTWLTLILAIAGLANLLPETWVPAVLLAVIPGAGAGVSFLTLLQTAIGLQGRWLKYRAAAERLREGAMRYRACLPPYDRPDAAAKFRAFLDEAEAAARPGGMAERFRRHYFLSLFWMPPELRGATSHAPDEGIFDRCGGDFESDERMVLEGRLRSQRLWHVRRARQYCQRFLVLQAILVVLGLVETFHTFLLGPAFTAVAFCTTCSLMLIAWRDFLDYGPLALRYVKIAGNLGEIEQAYREGASPFDSGTPAERLRRLCEAVEQTLASEFQLWYASQQ